MSKEVKPNLGSLENDIMHIIWQSKEPLTVRAVLEAVCKKRPCAYTTVMTVMNRLVEKSILKRRKVGGHYQYQAALAQVAFAGQRTRKVLKQLIYQYGDAAIAQFVDVLDDVDPKLLAELRKKGNK